jgi:hypothetical protein
MGIVAFYDLLLLLLMLLHAAVDSVLHDTVKLEVLVQANLWILVGNLGHSWLKIIDCPHRLVSLHRCLNVLPRRLSRSKSYLASHLRVPYRLISTHRPLDRAWHQIQRRSKLVTRLQLRRPRLLTTRLIHGPQKRRQWSLQDLIRPHRPSNLSLHSMIVLTLLKRPIRSGHNVVIGRLSNHHGVSLLAFLEVHTTILTCARTIQCLCKSVLTG